MTNVRIYLGTRGWGWRLFGIGYGDKWFAGISFKDAAPVAQNKDQTGGAA